MRLAWTARILGVLAHAENRFRYLLQTERTWQPRTHPNDWDIVVETYDAQVRPVGLRYAVCVAWYRSYVTLLLVVLLAHVAAKCRPIPASSAPS